MSKILLTHSYFLRFDPKQLKIGRPYAPLGTLYAASFLRHNGYPVSFYDTMFSQNPEAILPTFDLVAPDFFVIYDDGFNYLTKMCLTNMRQAAFKLIELAKKRKAKIIVSSSDSTDHYMEYLDRGVDFVIIGEAELTLLELLNKLTEARDFSAIGGIAYMSNGTMLKTPQRAVLKDLDSLPLPAWDLIDFRPYRKAWISSAGYFSINIATTRGCPFKCNWCAKPIYGNRYNSRSPRNVVSELTHLKRIQDFDHIWMCDDIFGLKPGWVREFADLVERENLTLRFKIQCRADLLVQENFIKDLARAGCENVWIGAESGSQRILDAMDKGITVEQIGIATRLLKKHGIKPSFFIQFGYLGETREDIMKTIEMINTLLPYEIGISVSYPLPGTLFYEKVKDDLKDKSNWTDSDDLALMFRNNYNPKFYKHLHRYVHTSYRKHLAMEHIGTDLSNPLKFNFQSLRKILSAAFYTTAESFYKLKLKNLTKSA